MNILRRLLFLFLSCLALSANAQIISGTITLDNERGWVGLMNPMPMNLELMTVSYLDGQNFDPLLTVWQNGNLIALNDNFQLPSLDAGITLLGLPPADYLVVVTVSGNVPISSRYEDGFLYDSRPGIPLSVGGDFAISVLTSPVPEPATYAMLLAGLAVTGVAARRLRRPRRTA